MPFDLEIGAVERTVAARAIFARLGGEGYVNLPVLSGVDLCMLGEPGHPFFWKPLATEWAGLRPQDRSGYIESRTISMIKDGRLIEVTSPDTDLHRQGGRYAVSPELGILLAARSHPTFVIESQFSTRLAPLSIFGVGDESGPVSGVVMAVPVKPPGKAEQFAKRSPLADVFDHILTTSTHAAGFLADRVIRPAPPKSRFQKQPHRLVTLSRPGDGAMPTAKLSILGNGTTAQVTGAGISGEFDKATLLTVLTDLFERRTRPA